MKQLFILITLLSLVSCKKSDSGVTPNGVNISMLTGTWYFQSETDYTYTNGSLTNTSTTSGNSQLVLKSDASGYITNPAGGHDNLTYAVNGNTITFDISNSSGGESISVQTITSLTSHQLKTSRGSISSGFVANNTYTK